MRTRRKRYNAEFKRETLRRTSEEGMTDVQVCADVSLVSFPIKFGVKFLLSLQDHQVLSDLYL